MCDPQAKQALGKQSDTAFPAGAASLQVNVSNGVFGRGEIGTQTDQVRATQPAAMPGCLYPRLVRFAGCSVHRSCSSLCHRIVAYCRHQACDTVWSVRGVPATAQQHSYKVLLQCTCACLPHRSIKIRRPLCCHCSLTMSLEAPCEPAAAKHLQVNKAVDDLKETAANPVQSAKNVSRVAILQPCFSTHQRSNRSLLAALQHQSLHQTQVSTGECVRY